MKRLLLLGGGHAHVQVLHELARAPMADVELTLVTPHARQMYSGMVPGLVAGHYRADDCAIALRPLAQAAGARLHLDAASALVAGERRVSLAGGGSLDYDLLSIDTGPVMATDALPGADGPTVLPVRPIERFLQDLAVLAARAEVQSLNIVVVGGGAAGVELALALAWRFGRTQGAGRAGPSHVSLVAGREGPLQGFPKRVRARAAAAFRRLGVTVVPDDALALGAQHVETSAGTRVACDAAVLALGSSAPAWLAASGLALDPRGFVATGPTLQSCSHPEVFAAGDVASRPDAPHPKSGVYAVRAGPPLATNLRHALTGQALLEHHPPGRTLALLSLGRRHAIASWGGWSAAGGWVWRWKDHIDRAFVGRYRIGG